MKKRLIPALAYLFAGGLVASGCGDSPARSSDSPPNNNSDRDSSVVDASADDPDSGGDSPDAGGENSSDSGDVDAESSDASSVGTDGGPTGTPPSLRELSVSVSEEVLVPQALCSEPDGRTANTPPWALLSTNAALVGTGASAAAGLNISKCTESGFVAWNSASRPNLLHTDGSGYQIGPGATIAGRQGVARIGSDGAQAWADSYDSRLTLWKLAWAPGATSPGVYATGSAVQLPGESPAVVSWPVLIRYSFDGTREWVRRLDPGEALPSDAGVPEGVTPSVAVEVMESDASGAIYLVERWRWESGSGGTFLAGANGGNLVKLNQDGQVLWRRHHGPEFGGERIIVSADGTQIYLLARGPQSARLGLGSTPAYRLFRLDEEGGLVWWQDIELSHRVVIDPVEQVIWSGAQTNVGGDNGWRHVLQLGANSVCVAGAYDNRYENGSVRRGGHKDIAIVCFNSESGDLQWAKQYRVGPDNSAQPTSFYPSSIKEMTDGSMWIAGKVGTGSQTGYSAVFKLNADGTF